MTWFSLLISACITPRPAGQFRDLAPPHRPRMSEESAFDRKIGIISLSMWFGTAVRVFPLLAPLENLQSLIAMLLMFVLVVAWPTWWQESYMKWRIPILSFLRVALIAMPFNFSTRVFDAIAPHAGEGHLAIFSNTFQMFLAIRIALLTFTSLGWRVPFRLHLLLQTINVAIFMVFGLHPYCQSKLLSSPQIQSATSATHFLMAAGSTMFLLHTTVQVPAGVYAERVAFVLFCWGTLGWLLPTLLLVPSKQDLAAAHRQTSGQQQQQHSVAWRFLDRCLSVLEAALHLLQPPKAKQQRMSQHLVAGPDSSFAESRQHDCEVLNTNGEVVAWLLCWWVVLMVSWKLSCYAAGPQRPMFSAGTTTDL